MGGREGTVIGGWAGCTLILDVGENGNICHCHQSQAESHRGPAQAREETRSKAVVVVRAIVLLSSWSAAALSGGIRHPVGVIIVDTNHVL